MSLWIEWEEGLPDEGLSREGFEKLLQDSVTAALGSEGVTTPVAGEAAFRNYAKGKIVVGVDEVGRGP